VSRIQAEVIMSSPLASTPLRVAIAGLGTVGCGTFELLKTNHEIIERRCGKPIVVTAVSSRSRDKDRGIDFGDVEWFDDAVEMAASANCDVVLELIGGSEGIALSVVETALENGRDVVTANKALIAHHGTKLAKLANDKGRSLLFEPAVAGGIPAIKMVREGLAANTFSRVYGILNGTCNYILTTMRETGRGFEDVLSDAQALGYAESDPTFDVDGIDAAHKLAILASLAFGTEIRFDDIDIEGIRSVSALDIELAEEFGYRIKLIGMARQSGNSVEQFVKPCLVSKDSPIGGVEGVFNAVAADGDFVGQLMVEGRGAGGGPTASATVADLIDIARGQKLPVLGMATDLLSGFARPDTSSTTAQLYIRLLVKDEIGVMASICAILAEDGISLESFVQKGNDEGEPVSLVLFTHQASEANLNSAIEKINDLSAVLEPAHQMRIETL
jgi:homoserine dehydrogenase